MLNLTRQRWILNRNALHWSSRTPPLPTQTKMMLHAKRLFSNEDRSLLEKWVSQGAQNVMVEGTLSRERLDDSALKTTKVEIMQEGRIARVSLNRPDRLNAMNAAVFSELAVISATLSSSLLFPELRAVILTGEKGNFSAGLDLMLFNVISDIFHTTKCQALRREGLARIIQYMQRTFTSFHDLPVPVIGDVKGVCIGAGLDLVTCCDLVICESKSKFSVKEVDLGIIADLGTLQRLPLFVGLQRTKELSYTGRLFSGEEAENYGLALTANDADNPNKNLMTSFQLASELAKKPPNTLKGIKTVLGKPNSNSVQDGLDFVRLLNMSQLFSEELAIPTK